MKEAQTEDDQVESQMATYIWFIVSQVRTMKDKLYNRLLTDSIHGDRGHFE